MLLAALLWLLSQHSCDGMRQRLLVSVFSFQASPTLVFSHFGLRNYLVVNFRPLLENHTLIFYMSLHLRCYYFKIHKKPQAKRREQTLAPEAPVISRAFFSPLVSQTVAIPRHLEKRIHLGTKRIPSFFFNYFRQLWNLLYSYAK